MKGLRYGIIPNKVYRIRYTSRHLILDSLVWMSGYLSCSFTDDVRGLVGATSGLHYGKNDYFFSNFGFYDM